MSERKEKSVSEAVRKENRFCEKYNDHKIKRNNKKAGLFNGSPVFVRYINIKIRKGMVGGMGKASGEDAEKIADTVRMAQKGSRDAFMELYQLFYHELYAYACYMLHHKQDAEDVVADTIVAAYESIGRLRDVSRFRQWLFKILSNKCRKKLKSYAERNRHHSRSFGGETEQDKVPDISDGKDLEKEATDREWLRDAFAVLTDEERYIVNSFLLAGYRGEEIAESLGIGASTLRSKYRRALMKMRKKLDQ